MPITDLSNVQTKMFGVSLLGDENKAMLQHWHDRFAASNSFFVAAREGESAADIAKNIIQIIRQSAIRVMDDSLMLALFLDLRKPLQRESLQQLLGLPKMLEQLLGCENILINCFGYTGLIAFSPKQIIKNNILLFQELDNRTHKLWLVPDDALGSEQERWKPTILFLDFLRRHPSPYRLLSAQHTQGSIGFMRYGEYQKAKRLHFQDRIVQLCNWIKDYGSGRFSERLSARVEALRQTARDMFLVDARIQPLHPDMFPKGFFNVQKAKHNKDPFHNARTVSQSAVMATGKELTRQIEALFLDKTGDPKSYLIQLLQESSVSISFVTTRQELKKRILSLEETVYEPNPIYLPYNPEGYERTIEQYLKDIRETAITKAVNALVRRLVDACDALQPEEIRKKQSELSHALEESRTKLALLADLPSFCQNTFLGGKGLLSPVHVHLALPGDDTLRILMCTNADDRNWIDSNVNTETLVNNNCMCYIDAHTGGIVRLDDTPVKCVFATYFDCTDRRLDDLLDIGE